MSDPQGELIVDSHCELGEGPLWHEGRVLWTDILGKEIHTFDPISEEHRKFPMPHMVTLIVPRQQGGYIVATDMGLGVLNGPDFKFSSLTDSGFLNPEVRFNDGKCDPKGRLWAGTMHRKVAPNRGALYVIESDFQLKTMADQITISNGLAWSEDGSTFYYIDTPTRRVDAFDYNVETGAISNRRPAIIFPDGQPGYPDGMTIDSEGNLWVAMWDGCGVLHCDPRTGKILEQYKVPLPVSQTSSCCFGGKNLDELYVTSAREGFTEEQKAKEPYAGGLFRFKVPARGLLPQAFQN